jgi:hypothetical protein
MQLNLNSKSDANDNKNKAVKKFCKKNTLQTRNCLKKKVAFSQMRFIAFDVWEQSEKTGGD